LLTALTGGPAIPPALLLAVSACAASGFLISADLPVAGELIPSWPAPDLPAGALATAGFALIGFALPLPVDTADGSAPRLATADAGEAFMLDTSYPSLRP